MPRGPCTRKQAWRRVRTGRLRPSTSDDLFQQPTWQSWASDTQKQLTSLFAIWGAVPQNQPASKLAQGYTPTPPLSPVDGQIPFLPKFWRTNTHRVPKPL